MRFLFNPITSQFNAAPPREIIYSETAPAFPVEGTRWVNTLEIREYVFTFDANGAGYWVEVGIGSTGPQGDTGDVGPAGPAGPEGIQGEQGTAATVAVGTVTTGEAGTSVSISNSGTSGAAVLDFTIPRGAVGEPGEIGPEGPQGPQGPRGDDGASVVLKGAVNTFSDLPGGATEGDLYIVENDGNGYVWSGAEWVNVGQIRGPKGNTGAQGPAGPAPAGTGAVVVNNGAVGTPVGYGTANVASTIVQRDANGDFSAGTITANVTGNVTGSVTGGVSGNAGTATKLATARTINVSGDVTGTAQSFDGSADIIVPTQIAAGSIVNADINAAANISDTKLATISTAGKVSNSATTATSANTPFAIVARDANGNFSANQITANLTGNVTGNATNVSGTVAIANGGTGSTTAAGALTNLGAAASGHTHPAATSSTAGFMSAADKTRLDNLSSSGGSYVHPTGDGNLHVPATGTTNNGRVLKAGATAGSAAWGSLTAAEVGAASSAHGHGNITGAGAIGLTASLPVITTTNGVLTTGTFGTTAGTFAAGNHAHGNITSLGAIGATALRPIITTTNGVLTAGSFGTTAGTFCQGNDSRLTASGLAATAGGFKTPSVTHNTSPYGTVSAYFKSGVWNAVSAGSVLDISLSDAPGAGLFFVTFRLEFYSLNWNTGTTTTRLRTNYELVGSTPGDTGGWRINGGTAAVSVNTAGYTQGTWSNSYGNAQVLLIDNKVYMRLFGHTTADTATTSYYSNFVYAVYGAST